jgi:hypothetical protein
MAKFLADSEVPALCKQRSDEWRLNLLKDGGRNVMHCGDPYEDDVERLPGGSEDRPGRFVPR